MSNPIYILCTSSSFEVFIFTAKGGHSRTCKRCETWPIFGTIYHYYDRPLGHVYLCQQCVNDGDPHIQEMVAIPANPLILFSEEEQIWKSYHKSTKVCDA